MNNKAINLIFNILPQYLIPNVQYPKGKFPNQLYISAKIFFKKFFYLPDSH